MVKIEVTDEQARLIERALDFYSRIGIGQFDKIKDHPTFERNLYDLCTPKKTPEVGDRTPQGEILEVKGGKALINGSVKNGSWNEEPEWKKLEDVKLSTDYEDYHHRRDIVDNILYQARNILYGDDSLSRKGNWGIYNPKADESCRVAYDILQKMRGR
jgi:hypothetical protein